VTSEAPLYERDPRAWEVYLAEGNAKQARKRVGADVILRDRVGRLLLVDPKYKPDWDLPGGMAEANEAPHEAAHRELSEELGLDLRVTGLLCVEWVPPHGPWDDSLMFIFNGGQLTDEQIASLKIVDGELAAFRFSTPAEAAQMLRPYVWRRVQAALDGLNKGRVQYLGGSGLSAF
jgi:8-oxo-dGTP diphosphatase